METANEDANDEGGGNDKQRSESDGSRHLSPRSDNVSVKGSVKLKKTKSFVDEKPCDNKSKENMGETEEKEEKRVPSISVRPPAMRKRSYSFSDGSMKHPTLPPIKRWKTGPGRGGGRGRGAGPNNRIGAGLGPPGSKNVLPSKFLLGGNINDPLNLNSLNDERIARVANAVTPESSPLPTPKHRKEEYKIEVLIPPNISDPLNLNADDDSDYESKLISPLVKRKKIRHRKRLRKVTSNVDIPAGAKVEGEEGHEGDISDSDEDDPVATEANKSNSRPVDNNEVTEDKDVVKQSQSDSKSDKGKEKGEKSKGQCEFKAKNEKFQYGNYNQYYGYRNPGNIEDLRLQYFKNCWFEDKEVLDIGCNIGHITISIAKNFSPIKSVGIDIDKKLIQIANKNIKHYVDIRSPDEQTKYPRAKQSLSRSFPTCLGSSKPALAADSKPASSPQNQKFPHNVQFVHGNYVLDCDELLENVVPEYDTILLLSTTKWIHLNFGDEGIKRVFRRIYAQLRPGGIFILEAQHFSTYKKKKKLTEKIFNNFKNIKLKPENFSDYLLHEVGFSRSEVVALPAHQAKGFQRPLQIFSKTLQSSNISSNTTPYSFGISPHCYNPSFTPFYGKVTPGYTPRPLAHMHTPLYSGPTPPLYYGPTPGGYSANSTPNPNFTPQYTPSYTPAHPGSPNYSPAHPISPNYSPAHPISPNYSPNTPGYSPSGVGVEYSPTPGTPGYSPSGVGAEYSPTPGYSPSAGYSPTPAFSPGNATPSYSPGEPAYSPSIQGAEVTGNTTPHPDYSCSPSPSSSPLPRYSWAGGESGSAGNTPQHSHTPAHTPVYEGGSHGENIGSLSSGENTPQHDDNNEAETADQEEEVEAEICQDYTDGQAPSQSTDNKK